MGHKREGTLWLFCDSFVQWTEQKSKCLKTLARTPQLNMTLHDYIQKGKSLILIQFIVGISHLITLYFRWLLPTKIMNTKIQYNRKCLHINEIFVLVASWWNELCMKTLCSKLMSLSLTPRLGLMQGWLAWAESLGTCILLVCYRENTGR